ncbi:hypothetical protein Aspvir_000018 [Aspergillus viridinutans]|uniref:Uncharacterized protein n=1 Tax=Aspergillus viridinutans TaxID=75553 RepID=A0A9P3F1E0_ASPVI|nr:uncharacterized protein Aspvir_000018 [Aspergillus viridinutans]GIJ97912.1 hypothetical protein Aspvir_000018 [Aspergillus viridinutans]
MATTSFESSWIFTCISSLDAVDKAASYGLPWRFMDGGFQEFIVEKVSDETARVTYISFECSNLHPGGQSTMDFKMLPWLPYEIHAGLAGQLPCGDIYTGSTLVGVPFSHGTIESVEGFEPKVNFKISNGHDWFRIDAGKKHGRLGITAIATDAEGRCMRVMADGVVELNEPTLALIMGQPRSLDASPFSR